MPIIGTVKSPRYEPPADPDNGTRSAAKPRSCRNLTIALSARLPLSRDALPPITTPRLFRSAQGQPRSDRLPSAGSFWRLPHAANTGWLIWLRFVRHVGALPP